MSTVRQAAQRRPLAIERRPHDMIDNDSTWGFWRVCTISLFPLYWSRLVGRHILMFGHDLTRTLLRPYASGSFRVHIYLWDSKIDTTFLYCFC